MKVKIFLLVTVLSILVLIKASVIIDGDGNSLSLSDSGILIVGSTEGLELKDLKLTNVSGSRLVMESSTTTLTLMDSWIVLDKDYSFTSGYLEIIGDSKITTSSSAKFSFQGTSVKITPNSSLEIDSWITFSCDPQTNTNTSIFVFDDASSTLILNSCTLHFTLTQQNFTKGQFYVKGQSFLESEARAKTEGIFLGDGSSTANNFFVEYEPGANLKLTQGQLTYKNLDS
ncbi:TPA: hypothetical protein DEO28_00010 [Candidatus Dependentiae bacterium]|nr:hypothetical protein [Candidatus Dependentiae bacterium]HBZ72888.1 hypothetical protein [Candidatus Dependentiae bacterium]